ncbi:unnamed protein product [Boreogadus saida]
MPSRGKPGLQAAHVSLTDSSSTHGGQSYEPEGKSSGRKHRSSHKPPHKHKRRRTADAVDSPALPTSSPVQDSVEEESMYTQLLAAVRGLKDRVNSFETHPQQAEAVGSAEASLDHLLSFQEQRHPDAISLYAQGSLLGVGQDQGNPESGRSAATSYPGDSTSGGDGTDVAGTVYLAEMVLIAAKIVGLTIPVLGASPADGVWAGIAQSWPTVSLPVADDFCQMLRKTWDAPSKPCQFNAGCRKLARVSYPPEPARRQIWLAQTALPEGVREELIRRKVRPGLGTISGNVYPSQGQIGRPNAGAPPGVQGLGGAVRHPVMDFVEVANLWSGDMPAERAVLQLL